MSDNQFQMPLHICPRCGSDFAADTPVCGNCGYDALTEQENSQPASETNNTTESLPEKEPVVASRPSVSSLFDKRYPRPLWFRVCRRLFITLGSLAEWLSFMIGFVGWKIALSLILAAYVVGSIIALFVQHIISFNGINTQVLFSSQIFQHLLFGDALFSGSWWIQNWWKVFILTPIVMFVVWVVFIDTAAEDLRNERAELKERQHAPGCQLRSALHISMYDTTFEGIAWSPDGKTLASSGSKIWLWQPETGEILSTLDAFGSRIAWSPDGKRLASMSYKGTVSLWHAQSGVKEDSFNFEGVSYSSKFSIAWSSDGQNLAVALPEKGIRLLDIKKGQITRLINSSSEDRPSIAWSPDEPILAVATSTGLQLWHAPTEKLLYTLQEKNSRSSFASLAWSSGGKILASSSDTIISLWDPRTKQKIGTLEGSKNIVSLSFSSDSRFLAAKAGEIAYSPDLAEGYIEIWRTDTWETVTSFYETGAKFFYPDNEIAFHPTKANVLATLGRCGSVVRIWELDLAILLGEPVAAASAPAMPSFSPSQASTTPSSAYEHYPDILPDNAPTATYTAYQQADNISSDATAATPYPFDQQFLARVHTDPAAAPSSAPSPISQPKASANVLADAQPPVANTAMVRYRNAKVVLVGDSGVGKSGLGLVLSGQSFAPTESTHGRRVWTFASDEVRLANGRKETHETLLWDLAGQPGYRLVHQLDLNEVTVALVVIDARSEVDPFAGVYHWVRALRMAQQAEGSSQAPLKKLLVAARIDRSGISASRARIDVLLRDQGFAGYFETSAKDGRGIQELRTAIRDAINWETLPFVVSTDLFQQIKDFLVAEKEAGRVLSTVEDLYQTFARSNPALAETQDPHTQFEICIGRVESRGLIRWLSFGNLVLLQPELLNAYASALVNAVKDEPDGLGSILEERVIAVDFTMPEEERLKNRAQEKVLMIAMVEDLLRYEIALREQAEDGRYLVFPSQSMRENPDLPDPEGKSSILSFEGPVLNIYTTLAVRLSHSGFFKKKDLWRNAITYTTQRGGSCGIFLQHTGEGQGILTTFFDQAVSAERRADFEAYIEAYLQRKALPESITRRRIIACNHCHTVVTDEIAQKRRAQGLDWLNCPVCDRRISLLEQEEKLNAASSVAVQQMDKQADVQRDLQAAASVVQGKQETQDFDVFLCHHNSDKLAVRRIGEQLKQHGILPWLDEWALRPGLPWQKLLEEQIGQIKSAAVFVGEAGIGPWQRHELDALLREFVNRDVPVIPVLLPDAPKEPKLPIFLNAMTWVDFRFQEPDPMQRLLWGITGKHY